MKTPVARFVRRGLIALTIAGTVTACGSGDEPGAPASPTAGRDAGAQRAAGNATPEEVAKEARGDVDCPPRLKSPARASNAAVDDVVGVHPGLTYEEAANLVLCTHDLMVVQEDGGRRFNIQTYGQKIRSGFTARPAEARVEKTSRQIMKEMQDEMIARSGNSVSEDMKPGDSKWYVGTMGLPGEERVISAAREEWFAEGRNPTMDSVEQALLRKYGAPTRVQKTSGMTYLTWTTDPLGRHVTETSPLASQCAGTSDPDGGTSFSPDCGVVVAAQILPMPENPALSRYLQVGVVDQAGGYQALTGTEQALQQQENTRRARQVEDASRNADGPKL